MSHTLSDGTTTVSLPRNMDWVDEFNWSPVQQQQQYALNGALLIDEATMQAGRPITLQPANGSMGFIDKTVLDQLYTWSETAGEQLTLTLDDGRSLNVMFSHAGNPVQAQPVRGFRVPAGTEHDRWSVTLKFIEV